MTVDQYWTLIQILTLIMLNVGFIAVWNDIKKTAKELNDKTGYIFGIGFTLFYSLWSVLLMWHIIM